MPKINPLNIGKPKWMSRIAYISLNGIVIEGIKSGKSLDDLKKVLETRYNSVNAGKLKWGEQ